MSFTSGPRHLRFALPFLRSSALSLSKPQSRQLCISCSIETIRRSSTQYSRPYGRSAFLPIDSNTTVEHCRRTLTISAADGTENDLKMSQKETVGRYTASSAFFDALWEGGVKNVFVNLGSDHPSILEAIVRGRKEKDERGKGFPTIYTCPNEMVALSMADGYARLSGVPQAVLVHVDVGTQGLGAAVHNASVGRAPVLIFAGLSPITADGELRGSRTEYIHWMQDVVDQPSILKQYMRYSAEIKSGRNIKQMIRRALQFATSDPQGPVYLCAAREILEEEVEEELPYLQGPEKWRGIGPAALPESAAHAIAEALAQATRPLIITGYSGRNHSVPAELVSLADAVPGLRVLDTGGSDMCFPGTHRACLGMRYGVHKAISGADAILVLDCDVPWIPTLNKPTAEARVFHIDVDPLKSQMPVFWVEAEGRWRADAATALSQINTCIASNDENLRSSLSKSSGPRNAMVDDTYTDRMSAIEAAAQPAKDDTFGVGCLVHEIKRAIPADTIFVIEAVTNAPAVSDQLQAEIPGTWINCGGGGLGWSGGAALGVRLASEEMEAQRSNTEMERQPKSATRGPGKFICQIVGDGTFLFSVPGSVYWIAARYKIPVLTVILNNKGWNAPRNSLLLVHPDGPASKASNEELHISFRPTPDYVGIAKAAGAGGSGEERGISDGVWTGRARDVRKLREQLREAVEVVKGGGIAVLEAQLEGGEGTYAGLG